MKTSFPILCLAASLSLGFVQAAEVARPADIVTPVTAKSVPPVTTAAEARAKNGYVYDRPTPQNSIVLLIDHQLGLMSGVRDFSSLAEYKSNVLGLAAGAKAFGIPVLLTSSNAQWQNGDLFPELKALFPDQPIYRRTGIINAYEDTVFREALEKIVKETGRNHIILAGVTLGTCTTFPVLSLRQDGYAVYPVIDATGAWNHYEADSAIARMTAAGAQPVTVFPLLCELQADWKNPSANAVAPVFKQYLPEYGFVMENFWNNAGPRVVPDPFGYVK